MDINAARTNAIIKARDYEIRSPLFLDTETTGIANHAEIVEIAIVNYEGQQVFQSLVKPTTQIPADATRIHGITNADVQHSPGWNEIWPEVSSILRGNLAGMYNSEYDLRLMRQSTLAHNIPWPDNLFEDFCVMKLFAEYAGEWNDYHQNFRWFTLEKAAQRCRLPLPILILNYRSALSVTFNCCSINFWSSFKKFRRACSFIFQEVLNETCCQFTIGSVVRFFIVPGTGRVQHIIRDSFTMLRDPVTKHRVNLHWLF